MYFVGIDVSKYKHDCFIATETGEIAYRDLTIKNNHDGFATLLQVLSSLGPTNDLKKPTTAS